MKCPDCKSTLFHVREDANGKQYLCCYKGKKCGWREEIKPGLAFIETATKKAS
jgi:hypothetical protein